MNVLGYYSPVFNITTRKEPAPMQILAEDNGQAICERVLAADSEIKYSSYVSADGYRLGEAIDESIIDYEKLTLMVLPLGSSCDVLVLAVSPGCNLSKALSRAKLALQ